MSAAANQNPVLSFFFSGWGSVDTAIKQRWGRSGNYKTDNGEWGRREWLNVGVS